MSSSMTTPATRARLQARTEEPTPARAPSPARTVVHADALPWLRAQTPLAGASVVTSLPDLVEVPGLGLDGWKRWFGQAAAAVVAALGEGAAAIFFQSDVRRGGVWIDKAALVSRAVEDAGTGAVLAFHKIVCRKPPGTVTI